MNLPQFNAEASLGPTLGIYRGKAVYGRSGAVEVLPMLPKAPTIHTYRDCRHFASGTDYGCEGAICWCCYSDGCWICNNEGYDCVWDTSYRTQPGGPPKPLGGVFETGGVFTTGGTLGTGGVLSGGVFATS